MQTARRFLNRYASVQAFQEIKAKYCPDGQACEAVIMIGILIGFMWIALLPMSLVR
jgi:hypothetical protein